MTTFTDRYLHSLKPRATPYKVFEGGSDKGFGVQVSRGRVKTADGAREPADAPAVVSFICFYRRGGRDGQRTFFKLGTLGDTSLAEARKRHQAARALLAQGIDPRAHAEALQAEEARAAREAAAQGTVSALFAAYVAHLKAQGKPSAGEVERALSRDAEPLLGKDTKARDVTPRDVSRVLNKVMTRGAIVQANRLRSYLSAAFRYGIHHDNHPANFDCDVAFGLTVNPARDVPKPAMREAVGQRALTADEIGALWRALERTRGSNGATTGTDKRPPVSRLMAVGIQLLLATGGQRVKEVFEAEWSEFDLDAARWDIPPRRTKNGRGHVVPLAETAIALLRELDPWTRKTGLVFPCARESRNPETPRGPIRLASVSRAVARLCEESGIESFTPRDLRRTCKTRMGELGLSKDIRDRLHNHALTDVSSKHYDRFDYFEQKRKAVEAWDDWLRRMVTGGTRQAKTVVPLKHNM